MNDTPEEIRQKQFDIIRAMPLSKRLNGIVELTELSRNIIRNRIASRNPGLSEVDLRVELFKTFYRYDFEPDALNKIAQSMRKYLERKISMNTPPES
jgi:hypothetical protein